MLKALSRLLAGIILCSPLSIRAQVASPYNHYGLGYLRNEAFSSNRSLAGLGAAYGTSTTINTINPASHAQILLTTFEAGVDAEHLVMNSSDSTYKSDFGSLSHLALAFPIKLGTWGAAISFKPYSGVKYNFLRTVNDSTTGKYLEYYTGKGNLYQVTLGQGVQFKGFSLGLNLGFLFGHIDNSKIITFPDDVTALATRNANENTYRGFIYSLGAQYRKKISSLKRDDAQKPAIYATAGAYGSYPMDVRVKTINYWERFATRVGDVGVRDTIGSAFLVKQNLRMPAYFGMGVSFDQPGKWLVGTEFRYNVWNRFRTPVGNAANANNYRVSIAGEISPDKDAKNILKQMIYRVGFYGGTSEYKIHDTQLRELGLTVGIGVPVRRAGSLLNLSFEYQNRGTTANNLYNESFYKFALGIVFNDRWFLKRKFD